MEACHRCTCACTVIIYGAKCPYLFNNGYKRNKKDYKIVYMYLRYEYSTTLWFINTTGVLDANHSDVHNCCIVTPPTTVHHIEWTTPSTFWSRAQTNASFSFDKLKCPNGVNNSITFALFQLMSSGAHVVKLHTMMRRYICAVAPGE